MSRQHRHGYAAGLHHGLLTGTITAPSEATLRRALANVDTAQLQRMSTEWTQALRASASDGESARLPAVAIDGKSVRGAAAAGNPCPHLLGAATHDGAIVIAQRQIRRQGQRDRRARRAGRRAGSRRPLKKPVPWLGGAAWS